MQHFHQKSVNLLMNHVFCTKKHSHRFYAQALAYAFLIKECFGNVPFELHIVAQNKWKIVTPLQLPFHITAARAWKADDVGNFELRLFQDTAIYSQHPFGLRKRDQSVTLVSGELIRVTRWCQFVQTIVSHCLKNPAISNLRMPSQNRQQTST